MITDELRALALGPTSTANPAQLRRATKDHHLIDAAAALDLTLTETEITALEQPYVLRQATWFKRAFDTCR